MIKKKFKINTSNPGKLAEFQRLFAKYDCLLESTHHDLDEIDSDALTVIAHKASQVEEGVLVDDTSLEVEGSDVGINVRWVMDHLEIYAGRKAIFRILLAYCKDKHVYIYEGVVPGKICLPQGTGGYGFDAVFMPDGSKVSMAIEKPDHFNARALAVEALMKNYIFKKVSWIPHWDGPWQKG